MATTSPSAAGVPATACSPPQALRPVAWRCAHARVCLHFCLCITKPMFGVLVWPVLARQRFSVSSGDGELPRHLAFICVCAGLVPVAPAVGAVLAYLRLAHWWPRCGVMCVVSSLAACVVPRLGVASLHLVHCGRLAFLVRVCLRWFPALLSYCLCMPNYCVSL